MLPLLVLIRALYRAHYSLIATPKRARNLGTGPRSQREIGALIGLHSAAM